MKSLTRTIATTTSRTDLTALRRIGEDAARAAKEAGAEITVKAGREAGEALSRLRQERWGHTVNTDPLQQPLTRRLSSHLLHICQQQITQRSLSTPTGWDISQATIADRDQARRLWLVTAEYRYEYSRRAGAWWQGASYLCGYEDGQYFAVRVPRTTKTIAAAEHWLKPGPVRQAESKGRRVIRQGDIYLVEMPGLSADDMVDIRHTSHRYHVTPTGQRRIAHPQHGSLRLPGKNAYRAYQMTQIHGVAAD